MSESLKGGYLNKFVPFCLLTPSSKIPPASLCNLSLLIKRDEWCHRKNIHHSNGSDRRRQRYHCFYSLSLLFERSSAEMLSASEEICLAHILKKSFMLSRLQFFLFTSILFLYFSAFLFHDYSISHSVATFFAAPATPVTFTAMIRLIRR